MKPYYQDDQVTLHHGDALHVLKTLDSGSMDCVVTSPPYFGLRDYGVDAQLGQESTPTEFVESLVRVFQEVHRVLADDGTFWLNLGDSYENKQLLGVPWRTALALQDAGWILRNEVIWHKNGGMPESVKDRLANKHEHIFLFTKQQRYCFDLTPIREEHLHTRAPTRSTKLDAALEAAGMNRPGLTNMFHKDGKNPGDVWTLNSTPFPGAHFATFPRELPRRCIQAGCRPGGVVLDPFSGSGTTGEQALLLGRRYIGIDVNSDYHDLALGTRLAQQTLAWESGGAA